MSISQYIFQKLAKRLSRRKTFIVRSLLYKKASLSLPINSDYVRYATLELCSDELNSANVKGNVAELGVFRGDFSRRLNALFPKRKLYLFDTFEGFHDRDKKIETENNYSGAGQDFSNTSIELVRSKMPHPEQCVFKAGYFPETAIGLDDSFCFVSLDADLYEPIYKGLQFFYPKLEKGGYIFIHDFNNSAYPGARGAVIEYCRENNISFVPIPDSGGSVIISK